MRKVKIYVGCALTHAPNSFKQVIEELKTVLRKHEDVELLDFIDGSVEPKNGLSIESQIYFHDIHNCVERADLLITDVTYPSIGLGWELGAAVERCGTPTIMCVQGNTLLSRLPRGAAQLRDYVTLYKYNESIVEKECIEYLFQRIKILTGK
ncbi:MAG: hypothetical protein WCQ32_00915 [bacterium]